MLLIIFCFVFRTQKKDLFSSLSRLIQGWKVTFKNDTIVIGGDFNVVPDLWLDHLPSRWQCHYYEEILS